MLAWCAQPAGQGRDCGVRVGGLRCMHSTQGFALRALGTLPPPPAWLCMEAWTDHSGVGGCAPEPPPSWESWGVREGGLRLPTLCMHTWRVLSPSTRNPCPIDDDNVQPSTSSLHAWTDLVEGCAPEPPPFWESWSVRIGGLGGSSMGWCLPRGVPPTPTLCIPHIRDGRSSCQT